MVTECRKSLRNLFESNANDAVTRSFAKDQIANINKTFADELKTAEGKEIIYKLSLKPEASNWDLSEWQSQFDEELAKTSKNTLEKYLSTGHLIKTDKGYRLSDEGFLLSNLILSEFI